MNTRVPHELVSNQPRQQLFRLHEETGGVCLNLPTYAVSHETFAKSHRRGVSLDLTSSGEEDDFLTKNGDGSISIALDD